MRLFSEKVNPTFNSSGYNILTVKDYNEIFFDVYEFEINGSKFVAEKTGELDDSPIISIPVDYNNVVENYDFVLHRGEQSIHFDPSTQSTPSQIKSVPDVEPLLTESVEEETDEVFLEEKKSAILEEIEKAKIAAANYIKAVEQQNKRELVSYQTEREKVLKEDIEKQKKILLDEFYSFVDQLKARIAEESSDTAHELKDIISEQLTSVSKDIDTRLLSAEKAIDTKLEERANELLNDVLLSEVKRSSKEIADDLNSQVKTIAENISKSLTSTRKQIEIDITEKLQEISTELNAKDKAIVELNNTLNKQSNRALSRIGTVKTQLESNVQDVVRSLEARIESASDKLEKYYIEKLQLVESSMSNETSETKERIISFIKESHQNLQDEIANIKVTVPNIVIEKSNGKQEIDVAALRTELEKSVSNRFVNEISSLKRLIELSSGGGSVAMQFAAGGTMNGNLTVVGAISASQYLGISIPSGDYLPLSGGTVTGDVSVSGLLSTNRIGFNTGAGLTAGVGQLTWNDTDGTLDLGLKGGNVTLQIGQEAVARVVNKTGADLLESQYRVVRIRSTAEGGAQGQRLAIVLAQANNDPNSVDTIGLVTENITVNQEGFVTTSGLVRNINTTGSLQGETWLDGDVLYLSPTTPGILTKVKPIAPNHTVVVGFVVYAHQNQGKIFVKVDNGYELDELHNVRITSVSANDVLKYNGTAGVWENSNTLTLSALSATSIFTTQLDALSANITVIDIKQYELSGFNVTGDVTINGTISASQYLGVQSGVVVSTTAPALTSVLWAAPATTQELSGQAPVINVNGGQSSVAGGGNFYEVYTKTLFSKATINAASPGTVRFELRQGHSTVGTLISAIDVNVIAGTQEITLNLEMDPIVWGDLFTIQRTGAGPTLFRTTTAPGYPLLVSDPSFGVAARVVGTTFGNGFYYWFYSPKFTLVDSIIYRSFASGQWSQITPRRGAIGPQGGAGPNSVTSITTSDGTASLSVSSLSATTIVAGTTAANPFAIVDIQSTSRGLLPPRMTSTQRNAISGASVPSGLTVFNSTDNALSVYTTVLSSWDNVFTTRSGSFTSATLANAVSEGATGSGQLVLAINPTFQGANVTGNLAVTAHFSAATKSFKIPHQTKGGYLQYGVVESNEHSVYVRGKTNSNIIQLPDHWDWLVDSDSVTTQLTPIGRFQPLFVANCDNKTVTVGGVEGLYSYVVYGTRKDVAPLEIEVE